MRKNRKKTDTYRFNGHPFLHAGSIHSVKIDDLALHISELQAKLADPNDQDDKKWTERWLRRYQKEFEKKQTGRSLKQRSKQAKRRASS